MPISIPLTLRTIKGSKLTFAELDGNFLDLRNAIYNLDNIVSFLSGSTDTTVTGGTYNSLTNSLDFTGNEGFNPFSVNVTPLLDTYVSGGTYNPATGCATFITTSGYTFDVCGFLTGFTDTNFANTDLTFTGNRTHDIGTSNYLYITNDPTLSTISSFLYLAPSETQIGNYDITNPLYLGFSGGTAYFQSNTNKVFSIINNLPGNEIIVNESKSPGTIFSVRGGLDDYLISSDPLNNRVGIGTNTPSEKLEVSGNTKITGNLNIGNILGSTPIINLGLDSNGNVVSGTTPLNYFTTGVTLSGDTLIFDRNDLINAYEVSLSGITYINIDNSPIQNPLNVDLNNDYIPLTSSQIDQDEANNYGSWINGSNGGTGFNPWVISSGPNTGVFLGDPSSDGMGTTGIGTNAFALYSTDGSNYVSTSRPFIEEMGVGDVFSFYWAINFDANGGNKGFDLKANGVTVFNANNNNSATITSNLPLPYDVVDGSYGTTPMLVTLTRTNNVQYNITITSRSGGPTYSAPINSSVGIDELNFYSGAQSDGLGQRNMFFNILSLIRAEELFKITVNDLGGLIGGSGGGTFTGNTSATCITDLYISNLHGCSPITVWDNLQSSNSSATGTTSFAFGDNVKAYGNYSHAEGRETTSDGEWSHTEGFQTTAIGAYSHAEGRQTIVSGDYSHVEGRQTIASGFYSHAEGLETTAIGIYSHTEGRLTRSTGASSHAEGYNTTTIGNYSHSEGESTTASGNYSHAEGFLTTAQGQYSHAEGGQTTASGYGSHAEGGFTTSLGQYSHTEGNGTTALGNYSHAEGYYTTASGDYSHAEGDSTYSQGQRSHSEGYLTTSQGQYSHAEGRGTTASGQYSHAEGRETTSTGSNSHAEGLQTKSLADNSHAEGYLTTSQGQYSHAEGLQTTALGVSSHAEGLQTTASGYYSHAEGGLTKSLGQSSHAEGNGTTASGFYSHAEGNATTTSGNASHAEGNSTIALGNVSHAEGGSTVALGEGSHAEGFATTAGYYSHAEGSTTTASGSYSHTEGYGTITDGDYQHAQGLWNVTGNTTQGAFIIGNGTDNLNRSNLLFAAGNEVNISGKTITTNFQMTSGATNGYVLTSDSDGNGFWLAPSLSTQKYATDVPFTGGTPQTITHSLNSTDIIVQLKDSLGKLIIPNEVNNYTVNTVDIEVSSTETYRVIIIG